MTPTHVQMIIETLRDNPNRGFTVRATGMVEKMGIYNQTRRLMNSV